MNDPDDRAEQALQEHIRRFPHLYPVSLGGTMPRDAQLDEDQLIVDQLNEAQHRDYADRAVDGDEHDLLDLMRTVSNEDPVGDAEDAFDEPERDGAFHSFDREC